MDGSGLADRLWSTARTLGRGYEQTRRAYAEGRVQLDLPRDEEGRVKLVCRRHAERRAVALDSSGTPACFDADHPACEGCVEDVRAERVETWE